MRLWVLSSCRRVECVLIYFLLVLQTTEWTRADKVMSIRNDQLCPDPIVGRTGSEGKEEGKAPKSNLNGGKENDNSNANEIARTLLLSPFELDKDKDRLVSLDDLVGCNVAREGVDPVILQAILLTHKPWQFQQDFVPCSESSYYKFRITGVPDEPVGSSGRSREEDTGQFATVFTLDHTIIIDWSIRNYMLILLHNEHVTTDAANNTVRDCVVTIQQYSIQKYSRWMKKPDQDGQDSWNSCPSLSLFASDSCGHYKCDGLGIQNVITQLDSLQHGYRVPAQLYNIDPPLPGQYALRPIDDALPEDEWRRPLLHTGVIVLSFVFWSILGYWLVTLWRARCRGSEEQIPLNHSREPGPVK